MTNRNPCRRQSARADRVVGIGLEVPPYSPLRPPDNSPQEAWCLHHSRGRAHPVLRVVPDAGWSGMYRVAWPDGQLSDLVNLSRAKDAAEVICLRGPPSRDPLLLHWQFGPLGEAHRRPPIARLARGRASATEAAE